jgi:predicted ArsR family transcriptional regulator
LNEPDTGVKEPDTGVREPDTFHVHEQMILAYFEGREEASSEDIALSLGLKPRRTRFFLQRMTMEGVLERTGNARSTRYKVKGFSK